MSQQRLSCACRANQQDVRLLQFDIGFFPGQFNPLVVVVDRYCKFLFRFILTDDVLIEEAFNLGRLWKVYVSR